MIEITIEHMERLEEALADIPEKIPRVAARAINRAAETVKTEMTREARKRYYVKYEDVQDTIKIYKANEIDLAATIVSKGKRRELISFRVRPNVPMHKNPPKVLRVAVKKEGGLKDYPLGFVARGTSTGKLHVLRRVSKKRYPIHIKYGPSVPQMIGNEEVIKVVEEKAQETLEKRIDHEINRALEEI